MARTSRQYALVPIASKTPAEKNVETIYGIEMDDYTGPDGKTYSLGHLKTTNYQVPITSNGVRYIIPLVLSYSNHCITTDKDKTVQATDPWFYVAEQNDGETVNRAFCKTRWESSSDLPQNLGYMVNGNLNCYDANKHGVYLHLRNPNPKFPGNGWYVMFNFKKAWGPDLVHLKVASHHHRPRLPSNVKKKAKPKPFGMVLEQWIRSKDEMYQRLQAGVVPGSIPVLPNKLEE